MKFLFIILFPYILFLPKEKEEQIPVVPAGANVSLKTANGCWTFNYLVVQKGDSLQNIPSTISYMIPDYYGIFTILDTLDFEVEDLIYPATQNWYNGNNLRFFYLLSPSKLYEYSMTNVFQQPVITIMDSFPVDNNDIKYFSVDDNFFLKVSKINTIDSFRYTFYNTPGLGYNFNIDINVRPSKFYKNLYYNKIAIVGDSSGVNKIIEIDLSQKVLTFNYSLDSLADNIKEIDYYNGSYRFLSSPGDSMVVVGNVHNTLMTDTAFIVFNSMNLNATFKDQIRNHFYFQPGSFTDTSLTTKLLKYDYKNWSLIDTVNINKKINYLHFEPISYGISDFLIFQDKDPAFSDSIYFYEIYSNYYISKIKPLTDIDYIAGDFRCEVGIEEIERNLDIGVFPVPAKNEVNVTIKGLVTGKSYKIDIVNISGRKLWESEIYAKNSYTIPIDNMPDGLLIVRVHTGTKTISKKIIKQ